MCLAISSDKRKYLRQFGEVCAIVSYDALNYFIGHYSKRQTQIQRMSFKKERHELVFSIQSNNYDRDIYAKIVNG